MRERKDRIIDAQRKRLEASERLAALLRGEPERIHSEQVSLWLILQTATVLLKTDLPAYTLLIFGASMADRYLTAPRCMGWPGRSSIPFCLTLKLTVATATNNGNANEHG